MPEIRNGNASETAPGTIELATAAEVHAGVDTTKAVTPATLQVKVGSVENTIGIPGQVGFGVGIAPYAALLAGFTPLPGYNIPWHSNYGNYQYSDGSIMVWIPKHYYRIHQQFDISAVALENPCKITTTANHGFTTGAVVFICNVAGTTQLNNKFYTITEVAGQPTQFTLNGINATSGYSAYSSGGNVCKRQAGVSAPGLNPSLLTYGTNAIDMRGTDVFTTHALANAEGYALHRSFIDGGVEQPGVMVDKYKWSLQAKGTGYVAASVRYGKPISTSSAHNPIASVSSVTSGNIYASAIEAAKGRSSTNGAYDASSPFFCCSRFIHVALAMISLAHGQAVTTDTNCAWYNATYNYPKGCNSDALKDTDDATVTYAGDGYLNCGLTGSGLPFAKTTHNGQDCGVADLNGLMYEVAIGATCITYTRTVSAASKANPCQITTSANHGLSTGDMVMITSVGGMTQINDKLYKIAKVDDTKFTLDAVDSSGYTDFTSGGTITKGTFYAAKSATAMKNFTSGNSLATDHWGATGCAAMMDALTPATVASMFKSGFAFGMRYGSGAYQVLDEALSGESWVKTGLGLVKSGNAIDATGTNLFGKDYYYQYIINELCLRSCAYWSNGSNAGVWCVHWNYTRAHSYNVVGGRSACYLL